MKAAGMDGGTSATDKFRGRGYFLNPIYAFLICLKMFGGLGCGDELCRRGVTIKPPEAYEMD